MNVLDCLETGLSTLATRLKRIGTKASFRTIASAMSLCLVAGIAAIIGGFSQDQTNGTAALSLPAERTITDTTGRQISGTVLEANETTIKFRRASDGKEFTIPLDNLSKKTQEEIMGKKIVKTAPMLNRDSSERTATRPLPADYTITNPCGYQIKGTVMEANDTNIKFRSDGYEWRIPLNELSQKDLIWLGKKQKATPILKPAPFEIVVPLYKEPKPGASPQLAEFATIPAGQDIPVVHESDDGMTIEYLGSPIWVQKIPGAKSVKSSDHNARNLWQGISDHHWVKMLKNRDPFAADLVAAITHSERRRRENGRINYIPLMQIVAELEMKPIGTPEVVSLRPEIEQLGLKIKRQHGPTCGLHTGWHMLEYQALKGNMPKLTFEQFRKINGIDHCAIIDIVKALNKVSQKRAVFRTTTLYTQEGTPLGFEFAKHELRHGRPLMAAYAHEKENGIHGVLVIGFKTTDQTLETTQFEAIDSNESNPRWIPLGYGLADPVSIEFR